MKTELRTPHKRRNLVIIKSESVKRFKQLFTMFILGIGFGMFALTGSSASDPASKSDDLQDKDFEEAERKIREFREKNSPKTLPQVEEDRIRALIEIKGGKIAEWLERFLPGGGGNT